MIAGVASGIGEGLAALYLRDGASVTGTYRSSIDKARIAPAITSYCVDITRPQDISTIVAELRTHGYRWDVLISSIGTLTPIGGFLNTDFGEWKRSFETNYFGQLDLVHSLRPLSRANATVVLFTGGAPGGVLPSFSAYSVAKIALTKMVEYLDAEDPDVKYLIVGPGWVNTKIHAQTLEAGEAAGGNLHRTRDFLTAGKPGTPMEDIYGCINWLVEQPKQVVGGRNFSVVWDAWGTRPQSDTLLRRLADNPALFKLRRYE
ncbi:MAG: SDR family oxidoreductase [Pseudomonadota bacterium]